jgi:hypothetical protein
MATWLTTFSMAHPLTFTFIVVVLVWGAVKPFYYAFLCWNRWMRSRNIVAHGWPTPPLDADGDIENPES